MSAGRKRWPMGMHPHAHLPCAATRLRTHARLLAFFMDSVVSMQSSWLVLGRAPAGPPSTSPCASADSEPVMLFGTSVLSSWVRIILLSAGFCEVPHCSPRAHAEDRSRVELKVCCVQQHDLHTRTHREHVSQQAQYHKRPPKAKHDANGFLQCITAVIACIMNSQPHLVVSTGSATLGQPMKDASQVYPP